MTELELHPDFAPTPATLFASNDPAQIVAQATRIADVIKPLIKERNLYKRIGNSDHVYIDAWTLAGTLLGVFATTVRTWMIGEDEGYGACVEARTMGGAVVGRAEAVVTRAEEKWATREPFQLLSMAQTRASSKALRMPLGFVMKLAGYEATPAEEMEAAAARGETVSGGKGVREGWRDIQEQNQAHQRLNVFVANAGLGEWVAVFLDSKGYTRPLSKPQMADLRRAVDRELAEREQTSETTRGGSAPPPAPGPTSDPGSPRPGSDTDASVTGPGDTDASAAGHEPPNAEATTSPASPGDGKAGRGRRGGRGATGNSTADPSPAGTRTNGRGNASDATSSVKQAGSAVPTEGNQEGADPSLLPEPRGWEQ